jgi:hypothetical protein
MDFGTAYGVDDRDYWGVVLAALQDSIAEVNSKEIVAILTQLKHFGLLNHSLLS